MAGHDDLTRQYEHSGQESCEGETWSDDARAKRAEALHRLAEHDLPLAPAEPLREPLPRLSPAHSPRRRWPWIAIALLLVVAVVGVLAHALLTRPSIATVSTPNTINPGVLGVFCIVDAAWSPDGSKIAILGYERDCPETDPQNYAYYPGIVTILDARNDHLIGTLHPDAAILAALRLPPPSNVTGADNGIGDTTKQIISYSYIAWSPDGTQLALTFRPGYIYSPPLAGVLVTDLTGMKTSVLSLLRSSNTPPDYGFSGRWDLHAGTAAPIPANATGVPGDDIWQLPNAVGIPALGYQWAPGGSLEPITALNSSVPPPPSAAPQPIGNPDGGATFSIWQSGVVTFDTVPPDQTLANGQRAQSILPGIPTFTTGFLAWSADGRYLAEVDRIQNWRFAGGALPTPSAQELAAFHLASAPVLPVRDRALAALLQAIIPTPASHGVQAPAVAWSPDGKLMAIALGPKKSAEGVPQTETVTVYNCATGQPIAHLATGSGMQIVAATALGAVLRWAPDSRHLLLYDPATNTFTTWGPSAIPHP